MDIKTIQEETAKEMCVDVSEVDYITDETLKEYETSSKEADTSTGGAEDEAVVTGNWGTYGNTITYSGDKCYWKQNKKGTNKYGCGKSESWNAGKNWCEYIIYKGTCSGGHKWYFLGNYRPRA